MAQDIKQLVGDSPMNADRARELLTVLKKKRARGISVEWARRLIEALEYVIAASEKLERVDKLAEKWRDLPGTTAFDAMLAHCAAEMRRALNGESAGEG